MVPRKAKAPDLIIDLTRNRGVVAAEGEKKTCDTIAAENTVFDDVKDAVAAREHLQEENILVLPLYGIEAAGHETGFPPIMVARIKALMYRQFFYCPYKAPVYEAVVRLDRIQPVIPLHPGWTPTDTALSGEALGFLMGRLREYFGAPEDEEMKALREIVQDALPEDAKSPQK